MPEIEIPIKIGDIPIKIPITIPSIDISQYLPKTLVPSDLNIQTAIILIVFVLCVFFLYRTMKVIIRGVGFAAAGFAFPWIVYIISGYVGIQSPLIPSIQTGIQFAALALILFFAYEFLHFIVFIIKIIIFPFRLATKRAEANELKELKRELLEAEASRRYGR